MKKRNILLGLILADAMVIYYIWNIFKNRGISITTVVLGLLTISFALYIHLLIKNKAYKKVSIVIGIGMMALPLVAFIAWAGLTCK